LPEHSEDEDHKKTGLGAYFLGKALNQGGAIPIRRFRPPSAQETKTRERIEAVRDGDGAIVYYYEATRTPDSKRVRTPENPVGLMEKPMVIAVADAMYLGIDYIGVAGLDGGLPGSLYDPSDPVVANYDSMTEVPSIEGIQDFYYKRKERDKKVMPLATEIANHLLARLTVVQLEAEDRVHELKRAA
jgi:hypothetical protein